MLDTNKERLLETAKGEGMRYRNVAEVEKALAKPLDRGLTEKSFEGFDTVPWNVAVKLLDDIFGPFGWSEKTTGTFSSPKDGVYSVTREITVTVQDDEGNLYVKTVTGVGASIVKDDTAKAKRTAAMGAASTAFSKATKMLGDAFGLYLYDEDEKANNGKTSGGNKSSGGGKGHPTEKQAIYLRKAGYTDEDIEAMSYEEGKEKLDDFFQNGTKKPAAKGKAVAKGKPAKRDFFSDDDDEDDAA